jgi:hypothetical protein
LFKRNIIFFLFIIQLAVHTLFAAERADFLIIENPASLKIYDRYQQELSTAEKTERLAFAPLRIINENELLGDQITVSTHVRLGRRNDYFIIKDNSGKLLNQSDAGKIEKLKNCMLINDNILIKKDAALTLKTSASTIPLPAGSRLLRVFKYKTRYYVYRLQPRGIYGWLILNNTSAWEVIKEKATLKAGNEFLSIETRDDILKIFKKVNRLYERYFDFFNQKTLKHDLAPRWDVQIGDKAVQAEFRPDSLFNEFKDSAAFTRRQLENVLIGTPYRISMQGSRLIISKNGGEQ